jgi:hypothetical protein
LADCAWITAHSETITYPYPNQIGSEKRGFGSGSSDGKKEPLETLTLPRPALVANSLFRGQKKRTMHTPEGQSEIPDNCCLSNADFLTELTHALRNKRRSV